MKWAFQSASPDHWPGTAGQPWVGAPCLGQLLALKATQRAARRDFGSPAAWGSSSQKCFLQLPITNRIPNTEHKEEKLLIYVKCNRCRIVAALLEVQLSQWRWTSSFIQPTSCCHTSSNSTSRTAWRRQQYGDTGGRQRCRRPDSKQSCSHSSSLLGIDEIKRSVKIEHAWALWCGMS